MKLERLDEARALDPARVRYEDPQAKSAAQNCGDTVLELKQGCWHDGARELVFQPTEAYSKKR